MSRDIKLIACPDFFGMVEQNVWISNLPAGRQVQHRPSLIGEG